MTPWLPEDIRYECLHAVELASAFYSDNFNEALSTNQAHIQEPGTYKVNSKNPLQTLSEAIPNHVIAGIVNRILSYPGPCSRSDAPWARAIPNLSLNNGEITMVLTDALLIQACRDYNLPVLAETLFTVIQTGYSMSKTFGESILFLIRQQLPSGAIGIQLSESQNQASSETVSLTGLLANYLHTIGNLL
jgi:hypothetical protein